MFLWNSEDIIKVNLQGWFATYHFGFAWHKVKAEGAAVDNKT